MFLIRYHDRMVGHVVLRVRPAPTFPKYPPKRQQKIRVSRDGNVIVQRAIRDSRTRQWIWRGYNDMVPGYSQLWENLSKLESKARAEAGEEVSVEVWENDSGIGGFGLTTDSEEPDLVGYTNLKWTRVRFIQVDRELREKGAVPTYETTFVEYAIDDVEYREF